MDFRDGLSAELPAPSRRRAREPCAMTSSMSWPTTWRVRIGESCCGEPTRRLPASVFWNGSAIRRPWRPALVRCDEREDHGPAHSRGLLHSAHGDQPVTRVCDVEPGGSCPAARRCGRGQGGRTRCSALRHSSRKCSRNCRRCRSRRAQPSRPTGFPSRSGSRKRRPMVHRLPAFMQGLVAATKERTRKDPSSVNPTTRD